MLLDVPETGRTGCEFWPVRECHAAGDISAARSGWPQFAVCRHLASYAGLCPCRCKTLRPRGPAMTMKEEGDLLGFGFRRRGGAASEVQSCRETRDKRGPEAPTSSVPQGSAVGLSSAAPGRPSALGPDGEPHSYRVCENTVDGCDICKLRSFLAPSWRCFLKDELGKPYMESIALFLHREEFYPPVRKIFAFSKYFRPEETKVVILGQDPYHGPNQAVGLAFSVPVTERVPPSLKNIFLELKQNYSDFSVPNHGDLSAWARQGVLLLNDSLTVRKNTPNSHSCVGWQNLTQRIVSLLSERCKNLVFILWGANAQKRGCLIDQSKHLVLMSAHPSPFSADRGFFGCKHFLRANEYLTRNSLAPIDWSVKRV